MSHPLAGQTVKLKASSQWEEGTEYRVEDSADGLVEQSLGNPARLFGVMRMMRDGIPYEPHDPDILYGKIGAFGHLVHTSEILAE